MAEAGLHVDALPRAVAHPVGADAAAGAAHVAERARGAAVAAVARIAAQIGARATARTLPCPTGRLAGAAGRPLPARLGGCTDAGTAAAVKRMVRIDAHPLAQKRAFRTSARPGDALAAALARPSAGAAVGRIPVQVDAALPAGHVARAAVGDTGAELTMLTGTTAPPAGPAVEGVGARVDATIGAAVLQAARASALAVDAEVVAAACPATGSTMAGVALQMHTAPAAVGEAGATGVRLTHPVVADLTLHTSPRAGTAVGGIMVEIDAVPVAGVAAGWADAGGVGTHLVRAAHHAASAAVPRVGLCVHAAGPAPHAAVAARTLRADPQLAHLAGRADHRTIAAVEGVLLHRGAARIAEPVARPRAEGGRRRAGAYLGR